jgi:two-component system, cell cycle response regulator
MNNCANSSLLHTPAENKMRILIADDDLTARVILAGVLKKWGYDPIMVKDGLAAWEILQQPDSPRLVILDWMMPGMDGLEVIRRSRAQFFEQPPYIILLTSKDEKGDIISGLETGANDYIKKPFDNEEFYARIRVGQRTIELQTRLYETQQTLAHLATHDPLTGILNRRAILEQLSKELSRTMRGDRSSEANRLSIGFFDIDHFKQVNDRYGHQAGDEVLKGIASILGSQMRVYDSFGRLGGDEFLVVTPGASAENCLQLFERLATSIAGYKIMLGTVEVSVTVSIGVIAVSIESGLDNLLDAADSAMYRAKREGGNRVVCAG